jgi:hypothetical protein
MNKNFTVAAYFAILSCSFAPAARAVDSASFELGSGNGADLWRIGIQWKWDKKWLETGNWHMGGYWDAQFGQWSGSGKNTITDFGLTPVFRFQETRPSGISPYVEGAIGFHLIQPVRLAPDRGFSSAFQFGDHVGAGARFGEGRRYDLSLRYQHLSNGGIKKPNNGINFTQLRFQYHFD